MSAQDLYTLQETDLRIAQARQEVAALEAELQDQSALLTAQQAVEQHRQRLTALRATQKDKELETAQLQTKVQELESQMYSGRVRNPRELEAMQADGQHLRARQSILDEDLLQTMLQGDAVSQSLQEAEVALQQEQARRAGREVTIRQRLQQLTRELEEMEAQRGLLATEVPPEELNLYQRLQSTRGGQAVARVEGGRCRGCNIAIPTHEFQRARGAKGVVQCGNCGRVLFVG